MKATAKEKKRLIFISCIIVLLLVTIVTSTYNDWQKILTNNSDVIALEQTYENLIKEEKSLTSEVTKLNDPEYVARFAKEKYLFSSEGEIIIRTDY